MLPRVDHGPYVIDEVFGNFTIFVQDVLRDMFLTGKKNVKI